MNAHDIRIRTLEGEEIDLGEYAGRPILIANTASECGFTGQYAGLQELWERFRDRGLLVLGLPSNDFGEQEPGDAAQIRAFCTSQYGVSFPLSEKTGVIQGDVHPFFQWIAETVGEPAMPRWNFHKYLVGGDGELYDAWPSSVEPTADEVVARIEETLEAARS